MQHLFLSYRFRPQDEPWASKFKRLVESHCLECVTGEDLGGEPILAEVTQRIQGSDALVALFLNPFKADDFHKWIFKEYSEAIKGGRRTIAVVQDDFPWANIEEKEYIKFNPVDPLPAFLKLSKTIGDWKKQAGRTVLIRLRPPNVAQAAFGSGWNCRYRLKRQFQAISDWALIKPDRSTNGIGFQVERVPDDVHIEIEVNDGKGGGIYASVADPQLLSVELKQDDLT